MLNNKMEIFNELCLLCSTYPLFVFTDYIDNVDLKYNTGWILIGATIFNIIFNLIVLVRTTYKKLKTCYKEKCGKK